MNCLLGMWFDHTNRLPINRKSLLTCALYYDHVVVGYVSILPALAYLRKCASSFAEHLNAPDVDIEVLNDPAMPRLVLPYLLAETNSLQLNQADFAEFLGKVNSDAVFFYEGRWLRKVETWEDLSKSQRLKLTRRFHKLVTAFFEFADTQRQLPQLFESLLSTAQLAESVLIEDPGPLRNDTIHAELSALDMSGLGTDQQTRLMALYLSAEIKAHYVCEGDPFLSQISNASTVTLKGPDASLLSIKDALALRDTKEWQEFKERFDEMHGDLANELLQLDCAAALDSVAKLADRNRRQAVIAASVAAGGFIPFLGTIIGGIDLIRNIKTIFQSSKVGLLLQKMRGKDPKDRDE